LHHKEPVVAYWIRLAGEGDVKKLSCVQRRFAYGFKSKLDRDSNRLELDMVADIGRPIFVARHGGAYRASMSIGDATCFIEKLFIHSTGSGLGTTVSYTEFYGADAESGEPCFEKLEP